NPKMTNQSQKPINGRKIFWAIVLVAVLGYAYGEPYLENWLGIDLPSIREGSRQSRVVENETYSESQLEDGEDSKWVASSNESQAEIAVKDPPKNKTTSESTSSKPYLTPTGKKNRLRSPAGLVYGESKGEHRVDHVMRHAEDDKNRPVHSVFSGSKEEILKLIDEAYEQIKRKSNRVRTTEDPRLDFRAEHTVDMKRKIGYLGGQRGRRENYPPRSKLTLVLDNGKFVVTAYPDR
ncbi:MAG: hypothetical protein AAGA30_10885, partial [Planctomycetota bacterium]